MKEEVHVVGEKLRLTFWKELKIEKVPSLAKNIYKRDVFNNVRDGIATPIRSILGSASRIRLCKTAGWTNIDKAPNQKGSCVRLSQPLPLSEYVHLISTPRQILTLREQNAVYESDLVFRLVSRRQWRSSSKKL